MKKLLYISIALLLYGCAAQSQVITPIDAASFKTKLIIPRYAALPASGSRGEIIFLYTSNEFYIRNAASNGWLLLNTPAYTFGNGLLNDGNGNISLGGTITSPVSIRLGNGFSPFFDFKNSSNVLLASFSDGAVYNRIGNSTSQLNATGLDVNASQGQTSQRFLNDTSGFQFRRNNGAVATIRTLPLTTENLPVIVIDPVTKELKHSYLPPGSKWTDSLNAITRNSNVFINGNLKIRDGLLETNWNSTNNKGSIFGSMFGGATNTLTQGVYLIGGDQFSYGAQNLYSQAGASFVVNVGGYMDANGNTPGNPFNPAPKYWRFRADTNSLYWQHSSPGRNNVLRLDKDGLLFTDQFNATAGIRTTNLDTSKLLAGSYIYKDYLDKRLAGLSTGGTYTGIGGVGITGNQIRLASGTLQNDVHLNGNNKQFSLLNVDGFLWQNQGSSVYNFSLAQPFFNIAHDSVINVSSRKINLNAPITYVNGFLNVLEDISAEEVEASRLSIRTVSPGSHLATINYLTHATYAVDIVKKKDRDTLATLAHLREISPGGVSPIKIKSTGHVTGTLVGDSTVLNITNWPGIINNWQDVTPDSMGVVTNGKLYRAINGLSSGSGSAQFAETGTTLSTTKNVGVGVGSPVNKLSVSGNTANALVKINQGSGWSGSEYALDVTGYSNLGGFRLNGADGDASIYLGGAPMTFAADNNYPIRFRSYNPGVGFSNTMTLSGGNMGIGIDNPNTKLHVGGDMLTNGNINASGFPAAPAYMKSAGFISNNAGSLSAFGQYDWGMFGGSNNFLNLVTSGLPQATLSTAGNFGINNQNPAYKLDVNGTANVGALRVPGGNVGDVLTKDADGNYVPKTPVNDTISGEFDMQSGTGLRVTPTSILNYSNQGIFTGKQVREEIGDTMRARYANFPILVVQSSTQQLIPQNVFTRIGLETISVDTDSGWNPVENWYTVPSSGTYHIEMKYRFIDNPTPDLSHGLGAGTLEGDSPSFLWSYVHGYSATIYRHGILNQKTEYYNQGDHIRMFAYVSNASQAINSAEMVINKIR